MAFHLDWHAASDGLGTRFFGEADEAPTLGQLLRVIAALNAAPSVSARPEFVADLRERLLAEALAQLADHKVAGLGSGPTFPYTVCRIDRPPRRISGPTPAP